MTCKRIFFLILAAMLHSLSLPAKQFHDFQIWTYDSCFISLCKNLDFNLETNFRWKDNAHTFFYYHVLNELSFHLSSFLIISPTYEQVWARADADSPWRKEYRPQLSIYLSGTWRSFAWVDRSRIRYRIFEDNTLPNVWQYRNKLTIEPTQWVLFRLHPLVWDEIFFEEHQRGIYENRFFTGVRFNLLKCLQEEIGYMRQTRRTLLQWEGNDIFLVNFRAQF